MTTALAIIESANDALTATEAGFDRVAVRISASTIRHGLASLDRGFGLYCPEIASIGFEPEELAAMAAVVECAGIWLPFNVAGRDFVEAAVGAGLHTTGIVTTEEDFHEALCRDAAVLGLDGVMLTTGPGRRLIDRAGIAALGDVVALCRRHGLAVAFAGLEAADVPRLLVLEPDELGFDRVLHDQSGRFDPASARSLLALMQTPVTTHPVETDIRVPDRIFVRDWTVAMGIGVYAHERGPTQRVRFNVEAELLPAQSNAVGLAGVVSYDLITDAITRLVSGHVDLVEEVAERLAGMVLDHPRVRSVDITVEKLDIGPGSLGCRIVRERPPTR